MSDSVLFNGLGQYPSSSLAVSCEKAPFEASTARAYGVNETGFFLEALLHVGTLVAVCIAFRKLIVGLFKGFFSMLGKVFRGKFSLKNAEPEERMMLMLIVSKAVKRKRRNMHFILLSAAVRRHKISTQKRRFSVCIFKK